MQEPVKYQVGDTVMVRLLSDGGFGLGMTTGPKPFKAGQVRRGKVTYHSMIVKGGKVTHYSMVQIPNPKPNSLCPQLNMVVPNEAVVLFVLKAQAQD